jgi:uncharacterized membrane protein YedE/YeeE
MNLIPMLAQVDLRQAVHYVVYLIVAGLIFGLLWWLIDYCGLPAPIAKIAKIIVAVMIVLVLIGVLLSLVGVNVARW